MQTSYIFKFHGLLIGSELFTIPLKEPEGTINFSREEYESLVKKLSGPAPTE